MNRLSFPTPLHRMGTHCGDPRWPYLRSCIRNSITISGLMLRACDLMGQLLLIVVTSWPSQVRPLRWGRIRQAIGTTDIEMSDASDRIRERKEKLEIAAEEARATLSKRRVTLDKVEKITEFAHDTVVGKEGLEPSRLAAHDPKSCSSTSSDTSPRAMTRRFDYILWAERVHRKSGYRMARGRDGAIGRQRDSGGGGSVSLWSWWFASVIVG